MSDGYSSRYAILIYSLLTLSLFCLLFGLLLEQTTLINITVTLLSILICIITIELLLIFKPLWLVRNSNLVASMDKRTSLYIRSVNHINSDYIETVNDRFVFDGLYFKNKPGISYHQKVETFDGLTEHLLNIDEIGFKNQYGTYSENSHIPYVFLGDSGTFGAGYSKPFPEIFKEVSRKQTLNLSIPGHGPQMYLKSFKDFGISKSPTHIIITLFHNDFDNAYTYNLLDKNGKSSQDYHLLYTSNLSFEWPTNLLASLILEYCNTCAYIDAWISTSHKTIKVRNTNLTQKASFFLDSKQTELIFSEELQSAPPMCSDPCRTLGLNTLQEINKLAKSINSTVILTYLPHPSEIYYPYIRQNKEMFHSLYQSDTNNPSWAKDLHQIAKDLNIQFADPRNYLTEAASQTPFLYRSLNDSHLSARGHEVFAKFLHNYLKNTN